jgi:hypothetical protein
MMRVLVVLGLMFLGLAAPLQAQDTTPDAALLKAIADRIDTVAGMDALFAACPADIFDTRSGWFDSWRDAGKVGSQQACADDPGLCAQECLDGNKGRTCLHLAQVYETAAAESMLNTHRITSRKAHALACAFGRPGGCTNRGGGIRNWLLDGDPFASMAPQARDTCLFHTFEVACAADDAWGCAMSGQSFAQGEGVLADPVRARVQFRKACLLAGDPAFEACVFAKSSAAALDGN